ncbi:GMC family oxidoreductase [Caulobacter segnis]|uniref:GMC oxidoreductase n=1 Tax=Caulobacter segnis TaxID=88688 RepID=UPI00240FDD4D|nr:GMC family oxidoreductase [Caulobacter segnis]MDG2520303.1 GMC family oxidoreductase [Caulobacter segnis]
MSEPARGWDMGDHATAGRGTGSSAGDQIEVVDCDVCIVGAGAAGLTLAQALDGCGLKICVLEGGGKNIDPAAQALFEGESIGEPMAVPQGRYRVLGGATRKWTGRCAELDTLDFEPRAWTPWSGWPIRHSDLAPYYRHAESVCGFTRPWRADDAAPRLRQARSRYGLEDIDFFVWRYAAQHWRTYQDWGERFGQRLARSPHTRMILGADLIALEGGEGRIEAARACRQDGAQLRIRASRFVLACGGLENNRLLLNFARDPDSGVADPHEVLGRWFMQHPRAVTAAGPPSRQACALFHLGQVRRGAHHEIGLALSPTAQAREGLLNASAVLRYLPDPRDGWEVAKRMARGEDVRADEVAAMARDAGKIAANLARRAMGLGPVPSAPLAELIVDLEQSPDPDSRVLLSGARDRLGLFTARVDWRISRQDRATAAFMTRVCIDQLRRFGLADLRAADDLEETGGLTLGAMLESYHHLGGTRMSRDPREGVIDADLRFHGLQNLYVLGGSSLPTGGHANPTFTIVALALRLADHLKAEPASRMMVIEEPHPPVAEAAPPTPRPRARTAAASSAETA